MLQSRVGGWIKNWWWKGKNEAHLPADDKPSVSSAFFPLDFLRICFSAAQVPVCALPTTSGAETDDVHISQIVWDEQKQKWVDLNEPEEEVCNTVHKTKVSLRGSKAVISQSCCCGPPEQTPRTPTVRLPLDASDAETRSPWRPARRRPSCQHVLQEGR